MMNKIIVISLFGVVILSSIATACSSIDPVSPSAEPVSPATTAAPVQSPGASAEMAFIVVDLEECAQNLGKNTGKEYKAKGIVLQLTRDQYIEFMRKEMYAYRSGAYASATDLVSIKCSIRLLDYLNQMSPDKKQWLADLFMAAYKSGYESK